MHQVDLQLLLRRYQAGQCTPEEQRQVEAWYDALEQGQPLLMTADEQEHLRAALWSRIARSTVGSAPASLQGRAWATVRWAAAAVLLLGAGLVAWRWYPVAPVASRRAAALVVRSQWRSYRNTTSHEIRLTLPDSSTVLLAPASRLRYPAQFSGVRREVQLAGEAFFRVQPDTAHPFLVYTDQLVTTVLGTSFRVRAYAGQAQALVKVSTGRVRVAPRRTSGAPAPSLVVLPNQQAVYAAGGQPLHRELVAEPVQLKPHSFVFDDQPVAEVLAALEQAYGVDIVYAPADVAGCTVNLNLRDQSLYGKLDVLCKVLGATYKEQDARITFHSAGCLAP